MSNDEQQNPPQPPQTQEAVPVSTPIENQFQQQEYAVAEDDLVHEEGSSRLRLRLGSNGPDRSNFIHGLSVGLGLGCIATFIIMWITVFFSPQLPAGATYEAMLSIFVYPLVYLLSVGLVALTAGIVREYFTKRQSL